MKGSKGVVLIVDDEPDIRELLEYHLATTGYTVVSAATGEEAVERAHEARPDLVILDLMLPGLDGIDVCRQLRADPETADIPVLMLTARDGEADVVAGLEVGADDYVTKPFSPRVLLARVKALLRRRAQIPEEGSILRRGDLVIDPTRYEVRFGEQRISLTRSEFRLLHLLARKPGRVFSREQIIEAVHGDNYYVTDRAVDVLVAGLRRKLGTAASYVETVRGVGYRFREDLG